MSLNPFTNRGSIKSAVAVAAYGIFTLGAVVVIWMAVSDILEQRAAVSAAEGRLAELESRSLARNDSGSPLAGAPAGSPFLEGATLNVAAAALLQRVATLVRQIGGNVISSQVDLESARAKDGWISLVVSCELDQTSLQNLLYDVETGMPFLFIDQLSVQPPPSNPDGHRMRVLLAVSGQWWKGK